MDILGEIFPDRTLFCTTSNLERKTDMYRGGRLIFGKTSNTPREILVLRKMSFNRVEFREFKWLQDRAEEYHCFSRSVRFFPLSRKEIS